MTDLCTLADVKLRLWGSGDTSDTTDDTQLSEYIAQVTDEFQEYTGRQFIVDAAPTDYYFDVTRASSTLLIPQGISTVVTVGYAKTSQPASGGTYTTITAALVLLRPLAVDRRQGFPADRIVISDLDSTDYFYPGYNTVKVNGTLGFTAIPPTINYLAIGAVVRRFAARKSGQVPTIGGEGFGGPAMRYMSPDERDALSRYVDPSLG